MANDYVWDKVMGHSIFGTDGVRGEANAYPMTAEIALRLGAAVGNYFGTKSAHARRVVIGKCSYCRVNFCWDGCIASWTCSNAGGGVTDTFNAGGSGYYGICKPQSVS